MSNYYFDSTGGCELCDAMEGWYDDEPSPPHPNCDCTIGDPPEDGGDAVNFDWEYEVGMTERDPDRPNEAQIVPVTVTVECYSGRKIIDSTDVEFEESDLPEGFAVFEFMDDEVYEEAAELAEELGRDCPPPPETEGRDVDDDYDEA
ncbi:MAG: hypothetical protein AABN33_28080 [Acidobacteriota bacterium]